MASLNFQKAVNKSDSYKSLTTIPSFLYRKSTATPSFSFTQAKETEPRFSFEQAEEIGEYDLKIPDDVFDWAVEDVIDWLECFVELPQYKNTFYLNCIDGRKLARLKAWDLPKMNITNFEHIKRMMKCQRELLDVREELFLDSIAFPAKQVVRHNYLIHKSRIGQKYDGTTPYDFLLSQQLIVPRPGEEKQFPKIKIGRANPPIKIRIFDLDMDLINQSENLPYLMSTADRKPRFLET